MMDCRLISAFTRVFRRAMAGNGGGGQEEEYLALLSRADAAAGVEGFGGRVAARHHGWARFGAGRLSGPTGQGGDTLSAGRRSRHRGPPLVSEARRVVGGTIRDN